jgi:NADH dehydrogenase FAD-containing subunit
MSYNIESTEARVDFSFKRELFFIVAGGIMGAIVMAIPFTFPFTKSGSGYALTWIVFGHIVGIHSPVYLTIVAGILIHIITGITIGVIAGIFLYKTNILNISKPSNGLRYGLLVGILVYLIFAFPVGQYILNPEFAHTLSKNGTSGYNNFNTNTNIQREKQVKSLAGQSTREGEKMGLEGKKLVETIPDNGATTFSNIQLNSVIFSIFINILFGITLGLFSSFLSIKFGARYRCPICNISFSRIDILQNHLNLVHNDNPINRKRIVILGGGFAGVTVLKSLQNKFQSNIDIDITMVSKDNYLLFTPMLHEVASGMIETRHIVTPVRAFCNRSRFYCAKVEDIDLNNKQITIRPSTSISAVYDKSILDKSDSKTLLNPPLGGLRINDSSLSNKNLDVTNNAITTTLQYDYLVIALGSETKFFGMSDVQKNAFTMKNLNDAISLRNHIIYLLEQADQLLHVHTDTNKDIDTYDDIQKKLLTFVIVGGGFAGVETAGEINDFIKDSVKEYYHNIESKNTEVIIIQSGDRLLPEMSKQLSDFAYKNLLNNGIKVILNTRVVGASSNSVKINNNIVIPTKTIIWSGGVSPNSLITNLPCSHDRSGRIVVDKFLEIPEFSGVYALGDCACITNPDTGKQYPPTAQHAIKEGIVAAKNIIAVLENRGTFDDRKIFDYKTKGMMASIGKRNGIGNLLGIEVQGFLAWWIWRNYYLANLPTLQKKLRVLSDWILDIFFKRDVTMLKTFVEEKETEDIKTNKTSLFKI